MEKNLTEYMTRRRRIAALVLGCLVLPGLANAEGDDADTTLEPETRHENIGQLITQFIQKSHYNHVTVDDELSSDVMDLYIDELDGNRMYLLASDIAFFEKVYAFRQGFLIFAVGGRHAGAQAQQGIDC